MSGKRSQRVARAPLARYTNYFEVGHNAYEFLIDFGQFQPEIGAVTLHTRIAVGPTHAKMLSQMLGKAVKKYETENSAIAVEETSGDPSEVILRSLPDFERRAVAARGVERADSSETPTNPVQKR